MILHASESGRFYDAYGKCIESVPKKDGTGTRDPTIRDARTMKLFPSVNEILKRLDAPELDLWKAEQLIRACTEKPWDRTSSFDEYVKWAYGASKEQATLAAAIGTSIHADIYEFFANNKIPTSETSLAHCNFIKKQLDEWKVVTVKCESSSVNSSVGIAGRTDMQAENDNNDLFLIDFKTTTADTLKKMSWPYYKYGLGLAGYAIVLQPFLRNNTKLHPVNIMLSRESKEQKVFMWKSNNSPWPFANLMDAVLALTEEWCIANKYWPGEENRIHEITPEEKNV